MSEAPRDDHGLAHVRTTLAHRRTSLAIAGACLLVVRLAAQRAWWASAVADPLCLALVVASLRSEWRRDLTHELATRVAALGTLALLILLVPQR